MKYKKWSVKYNFHAKFWGKEIIRPDRREGPSIINFDGKKLWNGGKGNYKERKSPYAIYPDGSKSFERRHIESL